VSEFIETIKRCSWDVRLELISIIVLDFIQQQFGVMFENIKINLIEQNRDGMFNLDYV
jgi:hypothetical protein